jgi:hypothetical protein
VGKIPSGGGIALFEAMEIQRKKERTNGIIGKKN